VVDQSTVTDKCVTSGSSSRDSFDEKARYGRLERFIKKGGFLWKWDIFLEKEVIPNYPSVSQTPSSHDALNFVDVQKNAQNDPLILGLVSHHIASAEIWKRVMICDVPIPQYALDFAMFPLN
jgi:hypothetical protein